MSDKLLISDLNTVEYNPRKISKKAIAELKESVVKHTEVLEDWDVADGFRLATTITVNRQGKRIVGGHQRVDILKQLGQEWIHEDDITWVDVEPDSGREKALCVSLNNERAAGRWHQDKLNTVLSEIQEDVDDLFNSLNLGNLQKTLENSVDSDEAEEKLSEIRDQKILMKDNVSFVAQEILDKYGDTIPQGFIFFAYKNRMHLMVQCDETCYGVVKVMSEGLRRENRAINEFLVGALMPAFEEETWQDIVQSLEERSYEPVSPEELDEEISVGDNDGEHSK